MARDFGSDVSTFPDLDPTFEPLTDEQAVAQCIARGLLMEYGQLVTINDVADCGHDVRSHLGARMTDAKLAHIKAAVEAEALRDERVFTADAVVTHDASTNQLTITVSGEASDGPYSLVLTVDLVKAELLT